ncbi:TorF family putative porin [Marinomonas sp. 5E14-1]|uniref:TorF family putative porin n=1 Tax=Marinomonas sp. 5E14-1 TaxID=3153922 RepID=UPI003263B864
MKKLITLTMISFAATGAHAQTTKQIGLMTDYLFRGITQTDNNLAAYFKATEQVGNAYGGIHLINIDTSDDAEGLSVEMDVRFGYKNQFDGFNIDLEVITYNYLVDEKGDETEFKIGTSFGNNLDLALYRGIKKKTWYPELSYEAFLSNRLYLDASIGYWMPDDSNDTALTVRTELGRDFPELYGVDIYAAIDFISDSTPFGGTNDQDDSNTEFVIGVRKNF